MPSESFKVLTYDSLDLADELRSDTRLLIKAHGSIDSIKKMIFTRAEYHKAKAEHSQFYELLKAIFLTHTLIFVGCGMEDPDVLLMLEDVKITGTPQKPHYALIRTNERDAITIDDWKSTYNIVALEYGGRYDELTLALQSLYELVVAERSTL
jgi:hypothetical protein